MKRSTLAVVLAVLVLPALAAFAVYVWPTRYRYSPGFQSKPRVLLVRVDRFTGMAARLTDRGWYSCRNNNPWESAERPEPEWSFSAGDSVVSFRYFDDLFGPIPQSDSAKSVTSGTDSTRLED